MRTSASPKTSQRQLVKLASTLLLPPPAQLALDEIGEQRRQDVVERQQHRGAEQDPGSEPSRR